MFAHIILASASTASSKMSAKHQENDTPVKASHLLLVDCGVSSSGSRTLSVGGAPQAREICVVPQEQCGVVTLCDLPTAEGQEHPVCAPRQQQSAAFFFSLAGQEDEIPHLL